jgi:hypothetical protein
MKRYVSAGCTLVSLAISISLSTSAFAHVVPGINGGNVRYVKCGASRQGGDVKYYESSRDVWTYLDQNGYSGTAKKVQHDQWSVYLRDNQGADVQLDMDKETCTWRKGDNIRSYSILDADDTTE